MRSKALRIGLIGSGDESSSKLLRLLTEQDMQVVHVLLPGELTDAHIAASDLDVWLLDLDDSHWHDQLDELMDRSSVPIFFNEHQSIEGQQHLDYWCRNLIGRMFELVADAPGLPSTASTAAPARTQDNLNLPFAAKTESRPSDDLTPVPTSLDPELLQEIEELEQLLHTQPSGSDAKLDLDDLGSLPIPAAQEELSIAPPAAAKPAAVPPVAKAAPTPAASTEKPAVPPPAAVPMTTAATPSSAAPAPVVDPNDPVAAAKARAAKIQQQQAALRAANPTANETERMPAVEQKAAPATEQKTQPKTEQKAPAAAATTVTATATSAKPAPTPPVSAAAPASKPSAAAPATPAAPTPAAAVPPTTAATPSKPIASPAPATVSEPSKPAPSPAGAPPISTAAPAKPAAASVPTTATSAAPAVPAVSSTVPAAAAPVASKPAPSETAAVPPATTVAPTPVATNTVPPAEKLDWPSFPAPTPTVASNEEAGTDFAPMQPQPAPGPMRESARPSPVSLVRNTPTPPAKVSSPSTPTADLGASSEPYSAPVPTLTSSHDSELEFEAVPVLDAETGDDHPELDVPMLEAVAIASEFEAVPDLAPALPCDLWVLGASLGGPAALKRFFTALNQPLPICFLLAQHIDAHFLPVLGKILEQANPFYPVQVLVRPGLIEPGTLLLAPIEKRLRFLEAGQIVLGAKTWTPPYSPCIDDVLKDVAVSYPGQVHSIVFSGMGEDGVNGARAIANCRGEVWVQDSESCASSVMPDAISKAGLARYRATPESLAARLMARYNSTVGSQSLA